LASFGFDPPLDRCVIALFEFFAHRRPDRVQVDVRRAGQQRSLVGKHRRAVTILPKTAPTTPRNSVLDEVGKSG
jgi:hypothetical protein